MEAVQRLRFDEKKATQAASKFLNLAGGRLNYMKLIKLLYMLDRSALLDWGRTVTGDHYYSMKHGPVLSEVLDLITTEMPLPAQVSFWASHIAPPSDWEVKLLSDAGVDALSEAEEEKIDAVWQEYGSYAPFSLVDHLHAILPEWQEVSSGRIDLPYRDILLSHMNEAESNQIEADMEIERPFMIADAIPYNPPKL